MEHQPQSLPEDVVRRTFLRLRQEGSLEILLGVLAQHAHRLEAQTQRLLEEIDASSPGELLRFGKIQGRLAETKRLIRVFTAWSKEDMRSRDDDGIAPE